MEQDNEYYNIMNVYANNFGANLGFNEKKCEVTKEKKVNTIKKIKKR